MRKAKEALDVTVLRKIDIEQESQDTASQPADNVHHSRKQQETEVIEEVDGGIDG